MVATIYQKLEKTKRGRFSAPFYTQEEITAVVNTVVEEAEKIAEVVVEEKEILSKEVIAIADAAAAEMLEKAKTSMPTTVSTTDNQPKATRKRKVSKKARKKK